MAQNVESRVNINVNADVSNASMSLKQLKQLFSEVDAEISRVYDSNQNLNHIDISRLSNQLLEFISGMHSMGKNLPINDLIFAFDGLNTIVKDSTELINGDISAFEKLSSIMQSINVDAVDGGKKSSSQTTELIKQTTEEINKAKEATLEMENTFQGKIDVIAAQFNALSHTVNEGLYLPFRLTKEELDNIDNLFKHLDFNIASLEGKVSNNTFSHLNNEMINIAGNINILKDKMIEEDYVLSGLNSTLDTTASSMNNTASAQNKNYIGTDELIHKNNELAGSLNNAEDAQNKYYMGTDGLIHIFGEASESVSDFTNKVQKSLDIDIGQAIPEEMLNGLFDNFGDNVEGIDSDLEVLKEAFGSGGDIIKQFASHLGINTGKVQEFGAVLGKLSPEGAAAGVGIGAIVATLKLLSNEADQAIDTLKKFSFDSLKSTADMFSDLATDGVDLFIDALGDMKDMIDSAIESLQELSEYGIEANNALFVMNNYLGNEGADNLHTYITELGNLKGVNVTEIESSMKGLFGSLSNMNLDAEGLDNYSKAFVNFMNDLSVYQGTTVSSIASQLESALSFGVLNSRSALAKALDITDEMIEQFKELGSVEERAQWILGRWPIFAAKYDEWLKTDQGKVTMLKNSWENLMSTVGQLALKVYAIVAPMLTQILNLVNSALSGIYKLFNIDTDTGVNNTSSAYSGLADSIKDVGNAAKEAERKTASFDDVIQISDSGSSSDITNALAGAFDMAAIMDEIGKSIEYDETLWEKWAKQIDKDISSGNWYKAGEHFGQFIYEWLDQIDWNDINKNVSLFSKNLSDLFNGLNSNKSAWLKIGETVGNSFNAITLGIKTFFENFDGAEFGDSLGFMWKNIWDTFDEQQAADALYEVFDDVFEIVGGFLEHDGFMSMAESITKTITGFFTDIAENGNASEYADTLYDLAKNILLSFANAIYTIVTDDNTKSVVKDALGTLFSNLANDADDIAVDLVTLVTSIFSFIGDTIVTPENINSIVTAIKTFIDTLIANKDKIVEALEPIITTITEGLKQLLDSGVIDDLASFVLQVLDESGVWDLIAEWMRLQMQLKFEEFRINTAAKICSVLTFIGNSVAKELKNVAGLIVGVLALIGVYLGKGVKALINSAIDMLNLGLKNIVSGINIFIKAGSGLLDKVGISVGEITFNGIPKLATGGIVTHSTIANIGEAGAEAVLPLERNTQWMDKFADKVASRLGNNVSQPITIDMSKCTKEYYTKSEMIAMGEHYAKCLKQAGLNVAVIM